MDLYINGVNQETPRPLDTSLSAARDRLLSSIGSPRLYRIGELARADYRLSCLGISAN